MKNKYRDYNLKIKYTTNTKSDIEVYRERALAAKGRKEIEKIKELLGDSKDKFKRAWRVTNLKTQKRFDEFVEKEKITDTKLLFHGSRNENWWSIINTGLVLRPTNAIINGKMFG